jgi:tol-pal system-associated acyl-CoA thioesterase
MDASDQNALNELDLSVRVYIEDTDAGGIVYYANYLKFMERARTEMLRTAGLEQSTTFEQELSFVVYEMSLKFIKPAQLDDLLQVECRLLEVRAASLLFQQCLRKVDSDEVCCEAEVSVACINLKNHRPRRIPPELRASLSQRS